ncbi:MAG: hypothetical protein U1E70_24520 [Acetobacteraceae bacterium]|nr:hypothetical protein [Pseudomonadota bacterium]
MIRRLAILLVALSFNGCTLIDQNTFAPAPEAKAQPAPVPDIPVDPRVPLVVIDYGEGLLPDYAGLLHSAVRAAESRYPDVQYDVIAVVADAAAAPEAQNNAVGVMRAIMRDRVPASRIHLGVRTDPAITGSQVRVYVR